MRFWLRLAYRLPEGHFSNDTVAMFELRAAFNPLGPRPKHAYLYTALVAVLLFPRLQFAGPPAREAPARVSNSRPWTSLRGVG